jgi:hypothetical protein
VCREGDRKAPQLIKEDDVSTKNKEHLTIRQEPVPHYRKTPVRKSEAVAWWTLQVQVFVDAFVARPTAATKARVERVCVEYAEAVRRGEVEPPAVARVAH